MEDVDEALRLISVSKASLYDSDHNNPLGADLTVSSKIYRIIRAAAGKRGEVDMRTIRERVLAKGFTEDMLVKTVDEYEGLDVWQVTENGARLVFIGMEDGDDEEEDQDVEMS